MASSIQGYIYAMTNVTSSASEELLSTVAMLPDQVLLEQTRMLARHEQALQLSVLDHLREIDARRLYLRRGFSSLFDYTVRELRYTEAAAWRRIKAMRLCRETRGVRERLQDGSLNLSNAALLQNSFERWDRGGGGPGAAGSAGAGPGAAGSGAAGTSAAPRAGSAPTAAPGKAAGAPVPVLDAHARQQLVERAMGKSTRQVQQMLAEVDPEAAAPAERLRPLGDGRWELKAVVDAECQRGLQQLRELLSHVDPHLTVGQLVGRLVREGVERYDPSRPPRRKRRKSDPAGDGCSAETAGGETADRVAAAAGNPGPAEKSAAPKRSAKATASRHFAGRLASRRRLWGCCAQERPRAAAGQPYFGAEVRSAACRARRERRRCGGDRADFGAEAPRGSRQFDCGSELPRRRIGEADFGGAASRGSRQFDCGSELPRRRIGEADFDGRASRGSRQFDPGAERPRRGIGGADFGGEAWRGRRRGIGRADRGAEVRKIVRQIDSGCGQARGLAARFGLLQLRRPAYRAALRLALLPGDRPHRAGRARRRRGAGKLEAPLLGSSPLPARSPAALRNARLGDVSKMAAPEIGLARDTSPGRRAAGAGCRGAGGCTRCGVRVRTLRVAMRRRHRGLQGQ